MQLLIISLLYLYTFFILYLIFNLVKKRKKPLNLPTIKKPVSIVIPFRNEEKNLSVLIDSLNKQIYNGPIELILVNDGSSDNSISVIDDSIQKTSIPVRVINSIYDTNIKLTSKQQALDTGIHAASYDWIALTDADMIFDTHWLSTLMSKIKDPSETALIFGHTSILNKENLFNLFQAFQLEFLFASAYSFHLSGITGSCMGNNILISKIKYLEIGGFKTIGYSIVEDRALIVAFRKKRAKITFVEPFKPTAYTSPSESFPVFFQQCLRWAIGGISFSSNLILPAILLASQIISLTVNVFFHFSLYIGILSILNFIITWLFVTIAFKQIKSPVNPLLFPLYFFVLIIEIFLFSFVLLFRPQIKWKGRKV